MVCVDCSTLNVSSLCLFTLCIVSVVHDFLVKQVLGMAAQLAALKKVLVDVCVQLWLLTLRVCFHGKVTIVVYL